MNNICDICGLVISERHIERGRVLRSKKTMVHSFCKVIQEGIVPECPLYDGINPKPCSNLCIQAQACTNEDISNCRCKCENLDCSIGQSVRQLRSKGILPWSGYIPINLRYEYIQNILSRERPPKGNKNKIKWLKIYDFLQSLSSHGVYKPSYIAEKLSEYGMAVKCFPDNLGIRLSEGWVATEQPTYGRPGIPSLDLGMMLYKIATGQYFNSDFIGLGYQYDDLLNKFKKFLETKSSAK
jgi:hypothetical protein